ncbi:hypothetical protein ACH5RR_014616 [Cinchona calisaya]|uniref:Uncharacterized protein n=1 Tax=Cinchona calisaya TaxID=153742 RepID=A0ABD2ZTJ0_9GENT
MVLDVVIAYLKVADADAGRLLWQAEWDTRCQGKEGFTVTCLSYVAYVKLWMLRHLQPSDVISMSNSTSTAKLLMTSKSSKSRLNPPSSFSNNHNRAAARTRLS